MFIGIKSLVMGKDAVLGQTMATSNKTAANDAAAEIAKGLGLSGAIVANAHKEREYQYNVSVGGTLAFRMLDDECTPKSKIPASLRPAKPVKEPVTKAATKATPKPATKKTQAAAPVEAPKRRGRPAGSKNKPKVEATPVIEVKRGPGRPKGTTNAAKAAQLRKAAETATTKANTRKVATGTTRKG